MNPLDALKGYRTLIVNVVGVLASILLLVGVDLSPEQQELLVGAVILIGGIVNVAMRFFTTTPFGSKDGE